MMTSCMRVIFDAERIELKTFAVESGEPEVVAA
jgi:hypothetical protein